MVRASPASIGSGHDLDRNDASVVIIASDFSYPGSAREGTTDLSLVATNITRVFSAGIGMSCKSRECVETVRRAGETSN